MFFSVNECQGQNKQKDLISRNVHMKYENSGTCCLKVSGKVEVFKRKAKLQSEGHGIKMLVCAERSCHKKYSCEISKL